MRRQIEQLRRGDSGCCPGHDTFPNDTYKNSRSKRARARDKTKEHKMVRTLLKRELLNQLNTEGENNE